MNGKNERNFETVWRNYTEEWFTELDQDQLLGIWILKYEKKKITVIYASLNCPMVPECSPRKSS